MEWVEDVIRWLQEIIFNEEVARSIKHMSLHAFQHFVKHYAPHIWRAFKDHIWDIFNFVKDWLSNWS